MRNLVKIGVSIIILAIITIVYFCIHLPNSYSGYEGLFCTNDGVMYAETRAIAEEGRFDMTNYTRFATGDTSEVDGRHYPNKPIGASLAAVPLYYLGSFISSHIPNKIITGQFKTGNVAETPYRQGSRADYTAMAGSFTVAENADLENVEILVSKVDYPGPTQLELKIVPDDNGQPGKDLSDGALISHYQTKEGWDYLSIPYALALQKDTKYWLVLQPSRSVTMPTGSYNIMRNDTARPDVEPTDGAMKLNPDDNWFPTKEGPFFKLFSSRPVASSPVIADYEKDRITIFTTSLLATVSAVLSVFLIFKILFSFFKLSFYSSWLSAIIFAVGTINWKYSRVFFLHTFSVFLVLLALYLLFSITILKKQGYSRFIWLGLVLGFAVFTDYANTWFVTAVLIYLAILFLKKASLINGLKIFGAVLGGIVPSVIGIVLYHRSAFGAIFTTPYSYYADFPTFLERGLWFTRSHLSNWLVMLIGRPDALPTEEVYGIFYCVPVLVFAFVGLYFFYRHNRTSALLILGATLALIIFVSFFYCVYGGGSHDYRYALTAVALLMIPLGFFIEKFLSRQANRPTDILLRFVFWGAVFFSIGIHYSLITKLQAHTGLINILYYFN